MRPFFLCISIYYGGEGKSLEKKCEKKRFGAEKKEIVLAASARLALGNTFFE